MRTATIWGAELGYPTAIALSPGNRDIADNFRKMIQAGLCAFFLCFACFWVVELRVAVVQEGGE